MFMPTFSVTSRVPAEPGHRIVRLINSEKCVNFTHERNMYGLRIF